MVDVKRLKELNEDPRTWDEKQGKMGPNHAIWEGFLQTIQERYTVNDY